MAETKVKNRTAWYFAWALIIVGALVSAQQAFKTPGPTFEWKRVVMDGHRAGAAPVTLENVSTALGWWDDEGYVAPNGTHYADDAPIARAALALQDVQPRLAGLKTVVGHSAAMLMNDRDNPDLPLANLFVDALRSYGSTYFKVPMDFAITNFGGIRTPLPEGAVTVEDVRSMFPFKNYLCYAKVPGSGLLKLFEQLSATKAFQAVSGATIRVKDHQLESALIGGKPIDPDRIYNVATIDFLLDGGDGIRIGALAKDVVLSHVLLQDVMMDLVTSTEAAGSLLEGKADGRVIMED